MMCAMCSCLEDDIKDIETLKKTVIVIREMFPQRSVLKFAKPDYNAYKKIMTSIMNNNENVFADKIGKALSAFELYNFAD